MAKEVIKNAKVVLDSLDFGSNALDATINLNSESQDASGFGPGGWREFLVGVKSWNVSLQFHDDFAASGVNEKIWDIIDGGAAVGVEITKEDTTVSATNPKWSGNVVLVGDISVFSATFGNIAGSTVTLQGTGALARSTT